MSNLGFLRRVTASALARVIACPGSEVLPHVDRQTDWGTMGDARHEYLQFVGPEGKEKALERIPEEHREMCDAIDLDGLPTSLASEVAFAYNWRTGEARELGRGLHRDYSDCGPDEIAGTIDALGLSDDLLYIGDYKGWLLVRAKDNAQLLFAALCGTKVFNRNSAVVEIINVRGSDNWRSKAEVDVFDLAAFASKLRETMLQIESLHMQSRIGEPQTFPVTEGDHCKYCPAFDSCPAKIRMIQTMIAGESIPTLNADTAAQAYRAWRAMKGLVDVAGARIHAYALQNPIQLENGRIFGEHKTPGKESIDGDAAYALIRDRLGQKFADASVSRKGTKAGITKAVRLAKADDVVTGTQKSEVDSILTELRATGAATRKPSTVVEEHKPKELKC